MSIVSRDAQPPRDCLLGVLLPDPTDNHAHPPAASVAPAAGKIGPVSVLFLALALAKSPPDRCGQLPTTLPRSAPAGSFPFRLFADARGRLVGAQVTGYMSSQVFVTPNVNAAQLEALLREQDAAVSRAAE